MAEVIASGWVAQGPRVARFEEAFAATQQAGHAVAVSNCTTALHLALKVAGIGPRDDVVVPSLSFIATANAVTYVGARPVFADVEADTGNVSVRTLAAALTPATRAVIVVDQGGMPVDLDADPRPLRRAGHHRDRGRGLRGGIHVPGPAGGSRRRARRLVIPPAQDPHHRRRRDADHRNAAGPPAPGSSANTP